MILALKNLYIEFMFKTLVEGALQSIIHAKYNLIFIYITNKLYIKLYF